MYMYMCTHKAHLIVTLHIVTSEKWLNETETRHLCLKTNNKYYIMQYSVTILDWSNEYTLTRTAHTHVHHTIISPTASITTTWDHNRSSRVVAPRRYAGLGAKSSPHLCIRHVAHQTENQHSSKHGWTSHPTPSNTRMWFSNVLSFFRRIALLPLQQLNYSSLTILTQRPHTSGIKSD